MELLPGLISGQYVRQEAGLGSLWVSEGNITLPFLIALTTFLLPKNITTKETTLLLQVSF